VTTSRQIGIGNELVVTAAAAGPYVTSIFDKLGPDASPDLHCGVLAALAYLRS
jgi:hypothetical protein